ncbi:hypothetical protein [Mycoplasmoides pirum]|uniref:p1-like adhesin n=1 Tax=Mycoplasmoides pirum TaxID=2122 RepID=Q50371_MYCPI|nr:hypothetical protein [Mycoplasmoides pirum]AAC36866.1 P1-like adhesin [Mycoplasmoides pirum]
MKKIKFNYKYLLISLVSTTIVSAAAISLYSTFNKDQISNPIINQNVKSFSNPSIVGNKVGKIRHWQNNNFNGVEIKNGGFVVLTSTQSATRIDAFGNILWEFDPEKIASEDSQYANLAGKKVVEITQDEGDNSNILYLLLIPKNTPDKQASIDPKDLYAYNELTGSSKSKQQATVVQIIENVNLYQGSTWTPSFTIKGLMHIDPKKMVDNYPNQWKSSQSSSTFFTKEDHPSWYVANNSEKVHNDADQNTNQYNGLKSANMVLPWKQYITNLGNMFAKNGIVLIFGGNGSIYNDPEALSIGMWKLDFLKPYSGNIDNNQNYGGIPYAYLLRYLRYDPSKPLLGTSAPNRRWNQSYAPIGQTDNFTYVPRLAVGGVQINASTDEATYLYLAAGITVGQAKESQAREVISNSNTSTNKVVTKIQDKRSLQLTGANTITNTKDTAANSIDPALLFGTAFNIDSLINLPTTKLNENLTIFQNVFQYESYFDVGATMSVSSAVGTYYYFDKKNHASSSTTDINTYTTASNGWNNLGRTAFPWSYKPNNDIGSIFQPKTNDNNNATYSYNLSLLIENAINYYYSTLSFGYSLKCLGGLTKIEMPSKENPENTIYGYAMQVGKSIVYLNEPKSDLRSIAYHGPSSISIGESNLVGSAKYGDMDYPYVKINNSNIGYVPSDYSNITNNIINTGVAIYVTGIKDFNDTIPTIASQFEIGNSPYEDNSSTTKTNGTLQPTIPWNDFVGLNSTNFNSEISSLWLNNNQTKTNNNEHFIVTKSPEISEYYGNAIWTERFYYNYGSSNNADWKGSKRAWFEVKDSNSLSNSSTTVGWQVGLDSNLTADSYYVQKNNEQPQGDFDVLLRTRDDTQKNNDIFFGQINNTREPGISYCKLKQNYGSYFYETISEIDRLSLLGNGQFVNNLSNQILTNNLANLLVQVNLSTVTGNPLDSKSTIRIVKNQFLNEVFQVTKNPIIEGSTPTYGPVIIVASNVDFVSQSATFTAYSWNSLTKNYDVMPRTNSSKINVINNSIFAGFSAMADWILPVVIAIPIVLVALIIGLGCSIGIPMAKHKKAIKVGFELQHDKVGTLTSAVGGVFKKIIDNTNSNNVKSKPQMLKAAAKKPNTVPPARSQLTNDSVSRPTPPSSAPKPPIK